jgi:Protein of unknown function (DUF3606)
MANDSKDRRPRDPTRIGLSEDWEVRYWTKEFRVRKQRLTDVVMRVGPMVSDVARELGKARWS